MLVKTNMSSKENTEFMRLIKASFNTSSYAVRNFITSNVIPNGKKFSDFLDDVLHDLYHKYQNQYPCCFPACESQPFPKQQKIFQFIFFQLYEFTKGPFSCKNGKGLKTGEVNGVMKTIRYCSCNVNVVAHIKLQNLDISILNKILQETGNSNPHVTALCDARNKICHAPTTTSLSHQEYMDLWTIVETEVLKLADHLEPSVKDMIKDQLELIQTCEIDEKTTEVLMNKLEGVKLLLKENQEKHYADIENHVSQCTGTTNAHIQSSTKQIIKSQNENTSRLLKSKSESTSQLLMSQKDLKSKLVDTQIELQKNTDRNTGKVCQTVEKTKEDILANVATRKQGEIVEANQKKIIDLLQVLIEREGCPSFHLQTRPSEIRTQSSSENVPGTRDIQLTCTIAQPSLTEDMEQKIVDSMPNEIDVTHDEENDEVNSKQTLKIKSKKVNSIVLEINATCEIFQSPSKLRSAICDLVEMVLDKGEVDKNAEDPILVTLSFESTLTEDEKATVINLLKTKYELINEGPNVRPKKVNVEELIEENDMSTHLSDECLSCCGKDDRIKQLEETITQLQKMMLGRTQSWLNEGPSEPLSDSGIDRSENLALNEYLSCMLLDFVELENSLKDLMEDLDISKRIWLAVGISLHIIIANALRIFVNQYFSELYESMDTSYNIETQMFPNYLKMYPKSNIQLNYEEINSNKITHGNEIHKYDYKVQNPVDLSKLFLPTGIAQYEDFEITCSLSSLIKIINHVDIFKDDVKDISREVESNISKIWARSDVTKWDEVKFLSSFMLMEKFVTKLQLEGEEKSILENLKRWENFVDISNTPLYADTKAKQEQRRTATTDVISDTPLYADTKAKQEQTRTATTVDISDTPLYADTKAKQEPKRTATTVNISDTPLYADTKTKQEQTRTATTGFRHGVMKPHFSMYCVFCKRITATINSVVDLTKRRCIGTCALFRLESTPIQCYVENSFESSLEQLRLMMREQNLDGREKPRIQIIFKEERDMKWTGDILNSFKEENNDHFSGIEFFHVSSINKG